MSLDPRILVGRYGRVAILELGGDIVEHAHPQGHGLIKIGGPDRTIIVAGREYVLRDDTVILLKPWVLHAGAASDAQASTRVLAVHIDLPRFAAHHRLARSSAGTAARYGACQPIRGDLREAALRLERHLTCGDATPDEADELFHLLFATYGIADLADVAVEAGRVDYRIRRVVARIRADPMLARDVAACTRIAGLSRPHFFQLFRQSTGVSPRVFGNSLRLEAALERLSSSSAPIHAIAEALGFSAPSHFTRFFLHHLGSTPTAYRHGVHGMAG